MKPWPKIYDLETHLGPAVCQIRPVEVREGDPLHHCLPAKTLVLCVWVTG
jgi:hypothetical protein